MVERVEIGSIKGKKKSLHSRGGKARLEIERGRTTGVIESLYGVFEAQTHLLAHNILP